MMPIILNRKTANESPKNYKDYTEEFFRHRSTQKENLKFKTKSTKRIYVSWSIMECSFKLPRALYFMWDKTKDIGPNSSREKAVRPKS